MNDDVRDVVAEFASDTCKLALRCASRTWLRAVAAAMRAGAADDDDEQSGAARIAKWLAAARLDRFRPRPGIVSRLQAMLAPELVTYATYADASTIITAAIRRENSEVDENDSSPYTALNLTPFRRLRFADLHEISTIAELSLRHLLERFQHSAPREQHIVLLPGGGGGVRLRSFALQQQSMAVLDLSRVTSLTVIRTNAFLKAAIDKLILPASIRTVEESTFLHAQFGSLDLTHTAIDRVPGKCFQSCTCDEVLLPPSVTAVDSRAFLAMNCRLLDLSGCVRLQRIAPSTFDEASIRTLQLPSTVTALEPEAFARLVSGDLNLASLTLVTSIPAHCFLNASLRRLVAPPSIDSVCVDAFACLTAHAIEWTSERLSELPRDSLRFSNVETIQAPR